MKTRDARIVLPIAAILKTPGIAGSRAAAEQRLVVLDDQILFALGPRTGEGAESLFAAIHAA